MSARVVHVITSLTPGGMEELVVNITNERNRRFPGSTSICCLDKQGELAARVEGGACICLDVDRARFPWDLSGIRRIRKTTADVGAGLLHSHNLAAQQYAGLAVTGTRLKHVYTQHGENPHNWGRRDRLRARALSLVTDRRVAVSVSVSSCMVPRKGITIVENGIGPYLPAQEDLLEGLRAELGINAGTLVMGCVGRLARVKGYDRLLDALGHLPKRPLLLLIGDGPERMRLESQVDRLGMSEEVRFMGYRGDARDFLGLIDLFVLPSRTEGLSVALLEAMWAGCSVLVTDVGESRAVIADGTAGTILPDDEGRWPDIIARCLEESDSLASRDRVRAARERVEERYMLTRTLDAYEQIYNEETKK